MIEIISQLLAPILITMGVCAFFAMLLGYLHKRWPTQSNDLVDAIDRLLPQTQCAQCGYPGCLPYARAIADEQAPLNLCPPGGDATFTALKNLLGETSAPDAPPVSGYNGIAIIDEARCIGCFLCIPACPVDAIVGAPKQMHTVISEQCTGCELCLAPCPVDCIKIEERH